MSSYSYYYHPFVSSRALPICQPQQQHSFPYYGRHGQQHQQLLSYPLLRHRLPCSRLQEVVSVVSESPELEEHGRQSENPNNNNSKDKDDDHEEVGISKIQVPRQKHIPVSKSQLLDAILSSMLHQDAAHHFRLLTSCLDSILHAEHKTILEEMRSDYHLTNAVQTQEDEDPLAPETQVVANGNNSNYANNDILQSGNGNANGKAYQDIQLQPQKSMLSEYALSIGTLLRSLDITPNNDSDTGSRVTIATRFQRAFMQLLSNAQFEELSARDLMLTSALNTDYLLTLPIYVDWEKAYESNAIIFRRGYATEKQNGLLIVEKLDYLQSKLLQTIFFVISKPLAKLGSKISEVSGIISQKHEVRNWTEKLKLWLKKLSVFQKSLLDNDNVLDEQIDVNHVPNAELPIWLAAQRAVARYEGILSPVGPRERLLRRLLSWIGLIPPTPETPFQVENDGDSPEPYLRPTFLSRISLSDTWRPATTKYCRNDPWKMLKTSISILFSQSVLQEPAFEELILLYTKEVDEVNGKDKAEVPSLQLKIYERIPFPDLPVVFPHKKLSFRIIDTVRLDAATILGLLAYFINYKFENLADSPSAVLLDVVAISALIIFGSRVVLGYKQTSDRYQLLVNKTLYEKTLASGFGSVHFLLDASEQQQYKEAILAYAVLLKAEKGQVTSRQSVGEKCERFIYEVFKVKVEMPIDNALNTLLRLSLATETCIDGRHGLLAIPCPQAYEALKERWNSLLC